MKPRSLKARAIDYLARREHSRAELARKLAPHAQSPAELDEVLNIVEQKGFLSNERFAAGLVHRKAGRLGTARILYELRQHGIEPDGLGALHEELRATELERARAVWEKRFASTGTPTDEKERARQMRFLAGRGFSHEVIRKVLAGTSADD